MSDPTHLLVAELAKPQEGEQPASLETAARAVGGKLQEALRGLLGADQGHPHSPSALSQRLKVHRNICSRVLSAVDQRDPLEVLHAAPGPEPLRRFLRAAARVTKLSRHTERALQSVDQFECLIRNQAGGWSALQGCISASLPAVRRRLELESKLAVFKGMSQLSGVKAQVWLVSTLLRPNADDSRYCDTISLDGAIGVQRLRPGVTTRVLYRQSFPPAGTTVPLEVQHDPVPDDLDLTRFFKHPPARVVPISRGAHLEYTLEDGELGTKSASDFFTVSWHRKNIRRYAVDDTGTLRSTWTVVDIPSEVLVFDTFLHQDVFPGSDADLRIYELGLRGIASVNDRSRDCDRVQVAETVEYLGSKVETMHVMEFP